MSLRAKLAAAVGTVAAVTLAISLLAYVHVTRLGGALYEIGVVRLPSIEGLNMLTAAQGALLDSERELLAPDLTPQAVLDERARQRAAWERAERGWRLSAPLPQTPTEALKWRELVPVWRTWRAEYDSVVSAAERAHARHDAALLAGAAARSRTTAAPLADRVAQLLDEITTINYEVAADARATSVASARDVRVVRVVMLVAAALGVLVAVGFAILVRPMLVAPLAEMSRSLARIADGDLTVRVPVRADDELGDMARAVNALVDARRRSDDLLDSAMRHSPMGIALVAPDGRFLEANPALCQLLGYDRAELLHTDYLAVTHPEDRDASRARVGELLSGAADTFELEKRYVRKDGSDVWVQLNTSIVRSPDGAPEHFVTQVQDVTERRATALALQASEEKFSRVFMAAPIGMSVSRLDDGRLLEVNREFDRIFGFRGGESRGRTTGELGVWGDAADRDAYVQRALTGDAREATNLELRTREGRELTLRMSAHVIELAGERYIVSTFADITRQHRAESALRHSEQRYRELVDGVRDAIFALSDEGICESLNPAFEQMTGMPPDEWLGKSFVTLVHPDDAPRARALLRAVLASAPHADAQLRLRKASDGHVVGEISGSPRRRDGAVVGVLGIARDISERVQLEAQLRQAQKMEAVGRLAGGIAHDFNNLLGALVGVSELLAANESLDTAARDDVETIRRTALRGAELTRSLLAFSRQQRLTLRVFPLGAVAEEFMRMARHVVPEDIALSTEVEPAPLPIEADAGAVEQILMNLVTNARDAMPNGGRVRIAVRRHVVAPDEEGRRAAPGVYAALSVADTGTGMDGETLRRVFEPFFTTKPLGQGTGLGLPMVYGLVRQLHGFVEIDSREGAGTTVTVLFPLARADRAADGAGETAAGKPPRTATGERILLVEDDATLRRIATRALERGGFRVTAVANGREAVRTIAHLDAPPDLIMSDVVMPEMSGPELVRAVRARGLESKVLFTSGYPVEDVADGRQIGPEHPFLAKPWHVGELLRTVREVLDARHTA